MSTSSNDPLLVSLKARGYRLVIRDGRLAISPSGAPQEIINQIRANRKHLLHVLLHVPEQLAAWSLEDMKALARQMLDFIDGPDLFEERTSFLPDFLRLLDRISFREEQEQTRGRLPV